MDDDKTRNRDAGAQDGSAGGGMPGDGAGRREDVRGSGVYPMSGPHPEGDAPVQNEESWGQGPAGSAGYQDSGTSEIIPPGGKGDDDEGTPPGGDKA